MKKYEALLLFYDGVDSAMSAKDELRDAGYTFELLDEIDECSNAVYATVTGTKPFISLQGSEVQSIITPFNGEVIEGDIDYDENESVESREIY
jgi:hypothetical protein